MIDSSMNGRHGNQGRSRLFLVVLLGLALVGNLGATELWIHANAEGDRLFSTAIVPAEYGAGGNLGLELRGVFDSPIGIGLRLGYGYFFPSDDWVRDCSIANALFSLSYRQDLGDRLSLAPYAGAGMSLAMLNAAGSFADYHAGNFGATTGLQFAAEAGIDCELALNERISLDLIPAYRLLAESGGFYHAASVSLGVSFRVLDFEDAMPMPDAHTALARLSKEPNIKVDRREGEIRIVVEGSFSKNDAKLEKKTKAQLRLVGAVIRDLKPVAMRVDGYVAEDQLEGTDLSVSSSRAEAVRDWLLASHYLVGHKLEIKARGLGRTNPVADNASEEGRARNRRVEIILSLGGDK